MIKDNELKKLIDDFLKLFPKGNPFVPEWDEMTIDEQKDMLREAIRDKKDISETKAFENHMERVL